ncbi:MAG: isoleucine--tRNA ligase [Phycisphaeraceae bacterium]
MNQQQQQQQAEKRSYKKTLNLPKTAFSMKANLVQNEPASQKTWQQAKLYEKLRERRADAPPFVFHDGPPYANGSIHLGHLENKVLKDLVVRSRTMAGEDCPYVPGWDCHGLPIEHKVMQELGDKAKGMSPMQIRKRCRDYAEKFVKVQAKQMQRLLTLADYDNPYLTMNPAYEAAVLEVFADLIERGLVYRGLKPVHWSIENQTALADAELEYDNRTDTAVYVLFEVTDPSRLHAACGLADEPNAPVHLMIWTTTPWTLPANLAVSVAPRAEYGLYELNVAGRATRAIVACDLAAKIFGVKGESAPAPLATCTGDQLVGLQYQHPFIDRASPVVAADYVSLDDGTGLVHNAPGHGVEDYQIGLREGLDIYCPVRDDGTFDHTAPDWLQGKSVWEGNDLVIERLRASAHLYHDEPFEHSYPHDWRSKTPVIFRATHQWFVSVDQPVQDDGNAPLRERALHAIDEVQFFPRWGYNRMRGMLESRPDWCLSRQRAWGLPIPAFYNEEGQVLLTPESVRAVAKVVGKPDNGSDVWFTMEPADLLAEYDGSDAPDWYRNQKPETRNQKLSKSTDIFDVWFESGSSWHAVIEQRFGSDAFPTDLYLEGSDQHRGWFQLSLLPAVAARGRSPFKAVLTHGFTVDKHGRKMSKSLGNTLEVEDLLKHFGADVCRWWVSGLSYEGDVKVDEDFFRDAGEQYRKVRNTIRFMLSNLNDYDAAVHKRRFDDADALAVDAWALAQLNALSEQAAAACDRYDFRRANELLFNFCNDTMSAIYLAAVKDRLYCDKPDSPRRRRTQTALHTITDALVRLLAPILPHTADEAWHALHGKDAESVHLQTRPEPVHVTMDPRWNTIMQRRDDWLKRIEQQRQAREIDNPLDLGLAEPDADGTLAAFDPVDLADLCGVSRFAIEPEPAVHDLRDQPRCERSWKRDGTVKQRSDGGWLSDRDADAVGV